MQQQAIAAVVSCAMASLLLPILIPFLRRRRVLDVASARSSHSGAVVRGAGLALAVAMALTLALVGGLEGASAVVIIGFATVGAWDDFGQVGPRARLLCQIVLSSAAVALALRGEPVSALLAVVGVVLMVATTNAVNFMDGINGITGLHAVIWGGTFAIALSADSEVDGRLLALALAGSALAFLPWNMPFARAFLGDCGSYLVGGSAGLLALFAWVSHGPLVALLPLAVYAADTSATVVLRWRAGERLFEAHHEHTYQRLLELGWTHTRSAVAASLATLLCCLAAIAVIGRPAVTQLTLCLVVIVVCGAYLSLPRLVATKRQRSALLGGIHA